MNVYLRLPKYLAEWCLHDWGGDDGVVRFPRGGAENDVLEQTLTTPPRGAEPQLPAEGDIAVEIPNFKTKPQPHYWYLTDHGRRLLVHVIYVRFRVALWNDLYRIDRLNLPITDVIYDWMERHGIEPEEKSWEAIRQIFFRQRKKYSKK